MYTLEEAHALFQEHDYVISRISFYKGEIQLIFKERDKYSLTIFFKDIYNFYDRGLFCAGPVFLCWLNPPGSFGWKLTKEQRSKYTEFRFQKKPEEQNIEFRIIAGDFTCRPYAEGDGAFGNSYQP